MSKKTEKLKVYNMTCGSCEKRIESTLKKLPGVFTVSANYSNEEVTVIYDNAVITINEIEKSIENAGYSVNKENNLISYVGIFVIAAAIILIGNNTAGFDMNEKLRGASYFVLFVTGMLTSIHCVGMCGGIMMTQSITKEGEGKFKAFLPTLKYNLGRVVSYTIIGGIVGALGSVLSLSLNVKAGLQLTAGVFMIIMGLNLAGFSIFRKFNLKLPWSSCALKKKIKSPFLVGILNGLMPCGPLQTMQLYALGTGSALNGALSMFVFSLGTLPLMVAFGAITGILSKGYTKRILKFSGFLVIFLGLIMGSRGLALAGFGIPTLNQTLAAGNNNNQNIGKAVFKDGYQEIVMTVDSNGYTPNAFYVKKDVPLRWVIKGDALNSCNNAIVVPSLNIEKTLKPGDNIIEFTPKDKDISFSCWMGMIRGVIKVTDNLDSVDTSVADSSIPAPSSGMSCCTGNGTQTSNPSIYGDDISKVPTSRLIKKTALSGNNQSIAVKGIGYEFEPLIIVANENMNTKIAFDLKEFDNPEGTFQITESETNETIASFQGKKDIVNVNFNTRKSGTYMITKDNSLLAVINVVENINKVDLETIRFQYLKQ